MAHGRVASHGFLGGFNRGPVANGNRNIGNRNVQNGNSQNGWHNGQNGNSQNGNSQNGWHNGWNNGQNGNSQNGWHNGQNSNSQNGWHNGWNNGQNGNSQNGWHNGQNANSNGWHNGQNNNNSNYNSYRIGNNHDYRSQYYNHSYEHRSENERLGRYYGHDRYDHYERFNHERRWFYRDGIYCGYRPYYYGGTVLSFNFNGGRSYPSDNYYDDSRYDQQPQPAPSQTAPQQPEQSDDKSVRPAGTSYISPQAAQTRLAVDQAAQDMGHFHLVGHKDTPYLNTPQAIEALNRSLDAAGNDPERIAQFKAAWAESAHYSKGQRDVNLIAAMEDLTGHWEQDRAAAALQRQSHPAISKNSEKTSTKVSSSRILDDAPSQLRWVAAANTNSDHKLSLARDNNSLLVKFGDNKPPITITGSPAELNAIIDKSNSFKTASTRADANASYNALLSHVKKSVDDNSINISAEDSARLSVEMAFNGINHNKPAAVNATELFSITPQVEQGRKEAALA